MTEWMMWFVVAGIVVILEMLTGTFYLLMISIGLVAGGVSVLLGFSGATAYVVAATVGAIATLGLRLTKYGKFESGDAARDPNVNLDIGQVLIINEWKSEGNRNVARVMYRGAMWDVELANGEPAQSGEFIVREVRGSRLIVSNAPATN
jgi:membrane protein implicated in regulation of membrane protease activity